MVTADEIRPFRQAATDYEETEAIKAVLLARRQDEEQLYLTGEDFDRIAHWKLRTQYGRVRDLLKENTRETIESTTRLALSVIAVASEEELRYRVGVLTTLRGVGTGVASAILALAYPEKYCVIDFRGWRQVFDEDRRSFTLNDYQRYLGEIVNLSMELGWPPQEVDLAIWAFDSIHNP